MNSLQKLAIGAAFGCSLSFVYGQEKSNAPTITGNMETTVQYLNQDTLIGANQPDEKALMNAYMNVFYRQAGFKAGMRVESYTPHILGYPNNFDGTGLGMRYVGYENDFVDVTVGHFYEQFGAGLIFRAYEDRALGFDNAMDGMRLILRPMKGVRLKGVYGRNRYQFSDGKVINSAGIVRGVDGELHLNEMIKSMANSKLDITLAGSMVSKYQADDRDDLILPENVAAYGGRMRVSYGNLYTDFEYIHKDNDPSADNNYIYNSGHAALWNIGYSKKGLGILVSAKSVDNFSFRSDRNESLQNVLINFLPPMNKTHTYNLVASLYPYQTQPVGEMAYQGEILYTFKKGSKLGGKYGTTVNLNISTAWAPVKHTSDITNGDLNRVYYQTNLFDKSSEMYWSDVDMNINKKFSKNLNMTLSYFNIAINNDVTKITGDAKGIIYSDIWVLETSYKINKKHSIRTEIQSLTTKKDKGDWATLLVEYNISPSFFFSVMDQYNYGNPREELRVHYLIGVFGYIHESSRITLTYGRQRAGLFCVGGVCRFVPASNGLTVNFTHSF